MKLRNTILIVLIFVSIVTFGQKKKKKEEPRAMEPTPVTATTQPVKPEPVKKDSVPQVSVLTQHYARKYATALQWNDYEVAKDALYDLIIENPANDSLILDLAVYYFQNSKSASAVLVANELIARNPKNSAALEIAASGYETLGVPDKALQHYETLYLLNDNVSMLYKMAFLQYQMKRYKESATSADIILANKQLDSLKVSYDIGNGKTKEYPIKVAVLNLKGMVAFDQGDKVGAKKLYQEALALAPDFKLAKEGLAKIK